MIKKSINWFGRLLLAHFVVGSVYYLSGYFYNLSTGKENVFSPIIGYSLDVIGWPWNLYGDFIHRESMGLKPSFVLTVLAMVLVLVWLTWRTINDLKDSKSSERAQ